MELIGVELGLWEGSYQNQTQQWLGWWDSEGNLLLTGLAAYWRSIRIGFEPWWWLYFLRRGKERDRWEGVAGDRVSPVGKKCNLPVERLPENFAMHQYLSAVQSKRVISLRFTFPK